jgi:Ca2+-binding RTX toxin-like protein
VRPDPPRGARDQLDGGDGRDILYGDAHAMSGWVLGENDTLEGGAGRDTLFGDAATAGIGAEALGVRGGDDFVIGGAGGDLLWGDFADVDGRVTGGRDSFIFGEDSGADQVLDFEPGKDVLDIRAYGFESFSDLTLIGNGSPAVTILLDDTGRNQILVQTLSQDPLTLAAGDVLVA